MELTPTELWSRIKDVAQSTIPLHSFLTWVEPAHPVALADDELTLEAPSRFHVEWLEDKFGATLSAAARQVTGRPIRLSYRAAERASPISVPEIQLGAAAGAPPTGTHSHPPAIEPTSARAGAVVRPHLNDRYTFDRFVVGPNSQLAAAACRAVAERPARMYNPLFVYGGVGLGKTHLMHAIGHRILSDRPDARVCYVSSEQFTNELVTSIQEGTMAAFRRKYRDMDLLLVDDIHFLEGKERTQEEFFHTFNALYDAQRQIILTSDRAPKEIPGLEARLVSRFEWGLVVDIKPPDYETRMAILQKKASDDGLVLGEEVVRFIAHHCKASVRELEGAIIKLLAYSSLTHQEITPQLARTALRGVIDRGREAGPVLSPERIRETVARRWRVRPEALASKRRTKDLTVPRQVAMYLIKETLGTPLVQIGRYFGGRDHSTVIHSIRKVEEDMRRDPDFRRQVDDVLDEVRREFPESD